MNKGIYLRGKARIGNNCEPYLIAEIGTNHNQDINTARELVSQAVEAGFDCVKFQTYEAEEIVSNNVMARDYGLHKYYGNITGFEMFSKFLKTPKEWFPELLNLCREKGIDCATTIHGNHGMAWARSLNFDLIKIASMDHNNFPFLSALVNKIDVPILISFGMAKLQDIDLAVDILQSHNPGFGIFHCVSIYPPSIQQLRLANISFFCKRYSAPVGFSDHTDDVTTSLIALAMGIRLFEKHITLDKNSQGPDHSFALEPQQMKIYVEGIRALAKGIDQKKFQPITKSEEVARTKYLKSIVAARDIPKEHALTAADLTLSRPGTGIEPKELDSILGRTLKNFIPKGSLLNWDDLIIK